MAVHEHEQIERLEAYWAALEDDPSAAPPADLDPDVAHTVRRLATGLRPDEPREEYLSALRRQLGARARHRTNQGAAERRGSLWGSLTRPAGLLRLGAAAMVVVALVVASFALARPQAVSAEVILQRAQEVSASPAGGGLASFALTEIWRARTTEGAMVGAAASPAPEGEIVQENRWWYRAPDLWRHEARQRVLRADGSVISRHETLLVIDGQDAWFYEPGEDRVTVNRHRADATRDISPFGVQMRDLQDLLENASTCYRPRVTGEDTVAGRKVHVVELGESLCPSASAPAANGRRAIWVDQETFFVLKQEQYDGDTLVAQREVTEIAYDTALGDALFTFTPPEGVRVLDGRPQALPTVQPASEATPRAEADPQLAALLAAMEPLAREADYPLYAPAQAPDGLTPRLPVWGPDAGDARQLWLEYAPADQVEQDVMATLRIVQQRATYELLTRWTEGAAPIALETGRGWLRVGGRAPGGGGTDSTVLVLRDGTLISISSFSLAPEALWEIADALQPVPGAHQPLPEPQPPTLADIRAAAPHPIYVPTWLPEGLTPEPPVGYEIRYRDADGRLALTVTNGTGLASDPRAAGETVELPNGLTAHLLGSPERGDAILWWAQKDASSTDAPVAITGPEVTRDELLQIAASMSATAELGEVAPRPEPTPLTAVPTPTPMPDAPFQALRPTWLPGPMTVREYVEGDIVTLELIPEGDDDAALAGPTMTLREMPRELAGDIAAGDPQASVERIGDHDVTVIRRGEGCVTYTWDVGDLRLTLTNVYDPPGTLKYMCDEMRGIVASVR